ncbi:CLUMA_CG003529, isoform A [Clunio marinus]|uniref:CLUMA_CG003529, isoform A n=1 Tax=Clunio marinus TaxID=568069 RepID=A0A1J1HQI1_9DIPT|nr:CLUMA_CG003529, isoform A [Clunio marinus]
MLNSYKLLTLIVLRCWKAFDFNLS